MIRINSKPKLCAFLLSSSLLLQTNCVAWSIEACTALPTSQDDQIATPLIALAPQAKAVEAVNADVAAASSAAATTEATPVTNASAVNDASNTNDQAAKSETSAPESPAVSDASSLDRANANGLLSDQSLKTVLDLEGGSPSAAASALTQNPSLGILSMALAPATPLPIVSPLTQASQVGQGEDESSPDHLYVADAGSDAGVLKGGIVSSPDAAMGKVDDLTLQILLKELELERFNMHYTMEVAKQGRWKGWRYGMLQEVNMSMGLTGAVISVWERGAHLHNPAHVNNARQENANFIPMIGAIIGASAAALEFGINEYHDIEARKKGFSPGKARAHVQSIRDDIDRLLAERETLMKIEASAPTLTAHADIDDVEGRVLRDLRDQNLQEFERFHIGARRTFAFQQMQFMFDMLKNSTNAIGYDFAFLSRHRHRRVWNGRAGVLFMTSGLLFMIGPICSRVFGKAVGEAHRKWLHPTTQTAEDATFEKLQKDHDSLDTMCKLGKCAPDQVLRPVQRSIVYGAEEKSFQDEIRAGQKSRNKAKLSATQNITSGMIVGGTKLASGILFTIPGYDHNFNRGKNFRADRVTNSLLFTASLIAIPATAYAMIDTLRINVQGEITRHKLIKAGTHPTQLAKARLAQIDDIEAKIKAQMHQ